ncbi:uncharacterized protein At1g28695-like [Jatropha curcas]|uniref:uncharacterized protein At1g28695-like n=1 Tax=Jatropha curcas TaxID=180498 RepID=UPI00189409BF|nr:uncharacterized protein At1g28695-like [Jatropha curcas]
MDFSKTTHYNSSNSIAAFLVFLFTGLIFIFMSSPTGSKPFLSFQDYNLNCPSPNASDGASHGYKDDLEAALAKASTANKSVIIAMANKAYVEGDKPMLDMFLNSFWLGEDTRDLVNHLLLITVDQMSFERCKFLRLHCYKLETDDEGFDSEKMYMSDDFIKMMWRRTLVLGDVLKRGYNFIFTDTDLMWLRNPFPRLNLNESLDLQISTDSFNGNERSKANHRNTGFYMIRSNNKTISLFESWYARKNSSIGKKEQDVLNEMMHEGVFTELGLTVRFLDTLYFSGFCQDSRDIKAVITVHANCCRTISAKIADLTAVIEHWKGINTFPSVNGTSTFASLKHEACKNSWI